MATKTEMLATTSKAALNSNQPPLDMIQDAFKAHLLGQTEVDKARGKMAYAITLQTDAYHEAKRFAFRIVDLAFHPDATSHKASLGKMLRDDLGISDMKASAEKTLGDADMPTLGERHAKRIALNNALDLAIANEKITHGLRNGMSGVTADPKARGIWYDTANGVWMVPLAAVAPHAFRPGKVGRGKAAVSQMPRFAPDVLAREFAVQRAPYNVPSLNLGMVRIAMTYDTLLRASGKVGKVSAPRVTSAAVTTEEAVKAVTAIGKGEVNLSADLGGDEDDSPLALMLEKVGETHPDLLWRVAQRFAPGKRATTTTSKARGTTSKAQSSKAAPRKVAGKGRR